MQGRIAAEAFSCVDVCTRFHQEPDRLHVALLDGGKERLTSDRWRLLVLALRRAVVCALPEQDLHDFCCAFLRRKAKGCSTHEPLGFDVRASIDENLHDLCIALLYGFMQGRIAAEAFSCVDVRTRFHQEIYQRHVAGFDGGEERLTSDRWRLLVLALRRADVCALPEQDLHDFCCAFLGGKAKGCLTHESFGFDVRTGINENLHDLCIALLYGFVKGCIAAEAFSCVDVCTRFHQEPDRLHVALLDGGKERLTSDRWRLLVLALRRAVVCALPEQDLHDFCCAFLRRKAKGCSTHEPLGFDVRASIDENLHDLCIALLYGFMQGRIAAEAFSCVDVRTRFHHESYHHRVVRLNGSEERLASNR